MTTRRLRDHIVARRNYRAFERALAKAYRYGGAGDLVAQYRRLSPSAQSLISVTSGPSPRR